jgi:hypothetical protein
MATFLAQMVAWQNAACRRLMSNQRHAGGF